MGKSFFLGELFRGVIFPESELVGSNRKYEMMIRWSQRGAYALLALLTILLITVWAGSFARNELYVREVQSYISEFNAERNRLSSSADDLRDMLPTLNALAKASNVYDQEAHPWLSGLGMYDGSLDAAADRAYASQLKRLVLPRLLRYLEARLRLGNQGGDLYDNFTTYMMFSKVEHMDKERVISWFDAFWDQELTGQATLRNELKVHTSALLNLELEPAELNKPLVSSVRTQLLQVPVSQRVYSRLRSKPEYANRINLLNEFGESARSSFVNNETVAQRLMLPYLFTKQAYDNIDLSPKSDLLAGLVREKWVLSDGENAHTDFAREDLDAISKDVKELYLTEYRSTWENIYSALEVRPFDDLRQANDVLLKFTDPVYSPLLAVLKVSVNNTSLTNQLFSNLLDDSKDGSKGKAAGMLAAQIKLNQVDTRFRELNLLLRESKDKPAPIGAAMQKIRQMQEFVNEMNISPDPGKMAFDVTKQRYQGGAGNAITSLLVQAKSMPDPLNRWMQTLANETWKVVLQSAHRNVDREWKNQVQAACNTALAGRYPFKSDSKSEVTMLDFTEFFKPGGTMDKFATEFVKPFVDGSGNIRGVDNHGLGLSAGTLAQISRAQTIKTVFFGTNPSVPSTSFQLRPYYMEKTNARFTLEVGDTRISYSHGPKFWSTLNWSGNGEKNRVRVLFEDLNDQQHSVTYDGPWAWFRLQDHSKLSRTPVANVYLATYSAPDGNHSGDEAVSRNATHTVRFEIKGQSANNPLNKDLLGGFRCADGI